MESKEQTVIKSSYSRKVLSLFGGIGALSVIFGTINTYISNLNFKPQALSNTLTFLSTSVGGVFSFTVTPCLAFFGTLKILEHKEGKQMDIAVDKFLKKFNRHKAKTLAAQISILRSISFLGLPHSKDVFLSELEEKVNKRTKPEKEELTRFLKEYLTSFREPAMNVTEQIGETEERKNAMLQNRTAIRQAFGLKKEYPKVPVQAAAAGVVTAVGSLAALTACNYMISGALLEKTEAKLPEPKHEQHVNWAERYPKKDVAVTNSQLNNIYSR